MSADHEPLRTLHLFAGAGGGLLADRILGHRPVGAVEFDPFCCAVLRERAAAGWYPGLRVHEIDIRLFDPSEYAGRVDCVAGGFPCQDISAAGKGAGLDGARSGLWSEFARVLRVVRPRFAFIENSPMLAVRGLDRVLCDLAALGFDARWEVISAAGAGAPHLRERLWIVAHDPQHGRRAEGERGLDPSGARQPQQPLSAVADTQGLDGRLQLPAGDEDEGSEPVWGGQDVADANPQRRGERTGDGGERGGPEPSHVGSHPDRKGPSQRKGQCGDARAQQQALIGAGWRITQPDVGRVADGLAHELVRQPADAPAWWEVEPDIGRVAQGVAQRVDSLKALGNGQVPAQAALAWSLLTRDPWN